MPRKKKAKGPRRPTKRHQEVAKFWTRVIRAAWKEQEDYRHTRKDVLRYLDPDHEHLFAAEGTKNWLDLSDAASVSVPMIAKMRASLAPRLHVDKPIRTVTPASDDGIMLGLGRVLQHYINYTAREAKLDKQLRKMTDEAILGGRGAVQLVWDDIRGIITSKNVRSIDLLFDPDVQDMEDAKWIAVRSSETFWETKRRISSKWRIKDIKAFPDHPEEPSERDGEERPKTNDRLIHWTVYSKMGSGLRGAEMDPDTNYDDGEDFVRLEIVLDHDVPIAEGEWDIPLYLDEEWPVTIGDLIETVDKGWPLSLAGQCLGSQRAVDLISSLLLSSCRHRERFVMLIDEAVAKRAQDILAGGSMADVIPVNTKQMKLSDQVHILNFGNSNQESERERMFHLQQFAETTGTTASLTGGEDPSAPRERSATASNMRAEATGARSAELKARVTTVATDAGRKEALAVRLLLDVSEVEPFVPTGAIGLLYISVKTPAGGEVPIRDFSEDRDESSPVTLADIYPPASNYFQDVEELAKVIESMVEEAENSGDARVIELWEAVMSQGSDDPNPQTGENGLPLGVDIGVVSVARVWEDTAGISPQEMMRELGWTIEAGSGVRQNADQLRTNADQLMQTTLPILLQSGDYGGANKILQIRDEAYETPQAQRVQLNPPPMPPPGADQ